MNEFVIGFQGGQSLRLTTHQTSAELLSELTESLKSTPSGAVKWHQGNGYLINLNHLSYVAASNSASLEASSFRP